MKTNKALLLIDLSTFCGTLILFIITSISNSTFGFYNLTINTILCFLAVALSVVSMIYTYYKKVYKYGVSLINLVVPIFLFLLVLFGYFMPIFGFVGNNGINNSIFVIMTFTFGARYLLVIAELLKLKSTDKEFKISKKSLDHSRDIFIYGYIFLKKFSLILLAIAILFSVINNYFLFMDLSKISLIFHN